MSAAWADLLALLPEYLGAHLTLTVIALAAGLIISLPAAILVTRVRVLRGPVLAVVATVQTIPSLALLALMVPLLRTIGFLPAVIALTLYSMLPIVRNTVTGIEEVDPDLIEAARGLGMTDLQVLRLVQLPLAMPVIIAGIRTAAVWVVGIATLSTPVGAASLGNYIFTGLQTQNHRAVLVGCLSAAALALVLDGVIRLLEVASRRRRGRVIVPAVLGLLIVAPLIAPLLVGRSPNAAHPGHPGVTIGAKTFTEQYILARLIADRLAAAGIDASVLESLGSAIVFDALAAGRIDAYVDYSGTIWANHMQRDDMPAADVVLREMSAWLQRERGIICLGPLGFENAYALAMPRQTAGRLGIATVADLAAHADGMAIGGDYEFFGRPEWLALRDAYGLTFDRRVPMDSTLMYSAARAGEVDVIAAFTTDGRIAALDLVVLEDPLDVLPPYDAVLLLAAPAAGDARLLQALHPLIDAIDDRAMRQANRLVDVDGRSVTEAAASLMRVIEGEQ